MSAKVDSVVSIRKYKPSDKEACRSLWRELTEWHRDLYADPSIGGKHPEVFFDKHLKKVGPGKIWVAVKGAQVVGFAGLVVGDEEAELEPIVVAKEHRGQGIGRRLVEAVVSEAESMGVRFLNVRPVARNASAIRYFAGRGFNKVGRVELFIDYTGTKWKKGLRMHDTEFQH
ncbi:MAG TPA: GNAT family N-acetyltransferase [Thermoplasmata archaeon]|jgi:GNAT superfamily N-acetyltransferase